MVQDEGLDNILKDVVEIHKKLSTIVTALNRQMDKEKRKEELIEKYKEKSKLVSDRIRQLEKELI